MFAIVSEPAYRGTSALDQSEAGEYLQMETFGLNYGDSRR
jgi:hypothetical protein